MTTSRFLHREGQWQPEDVFWGQRHFEAMKRHQWLKLAGFGDGHTCEKSTETITDDIVRNARLKRFER